ncbi:MAG: phosphatase PAP2 family protein [Chloroflexota bacterium]
MDQGLNWSFARAINGMAGHSALLDRLGVFLANDAVFLIVLGAATWWLLPFGSDAGKRAALAAAAALIGGLVVAFVIAHLVQVPRPFVAHHVDLLIQHSATDSSFPSDHATASFAVASTALARRMPWRWPLLIAAALVAIARVYVGVHYPLDVIVGALIGTGFAIALWRLDARIARPASFAIGVARRLRLG